MLPYPFNNFFTPMIRIVTIIVSYNESIKSYIRFMSSWHNLEEVSRFNYTRTFVNNILNSSLTLSSSFSVPISNTVAKRS